MKLLIEESLLDDAMANAEGYDWQTFSTAESSRETMTAMAASAESLVFRWPLKFCLDAEFFAACPNLKHVHKSGSGFEHSQVLDVAAATVAGVMVSNNAGLNADVVAEHAILMTLLAMRPDTVTHINRMRDGQWDPSPAEGVARPRTLVGKTVGIVGLGQIGTCVAARMKAMRVGRILGHQRNRRFEQTYYAGVEWCSLRTLMAESDVIVLCLPINADTVGIISRDMIAAMRPGAVVVNVGRGGVVDEAALYEALKQRRIAAAGLDVLETEPSDTPLMTLQNAFITPHTAGTAVEMQRIQMVEAIEAARAFARGNLPPRLVNPEVASSQALRATWLK